MRRPALLAASTSVLLLGAACGTLPRALGPLPVRNQHPAQLLAAHLDPVPAQVLPAGGMAVALQNTYTSLWLTDESNPDGSSLFLDGELWRLALDLRLGLGAGFELETELPFGYGTGGGLDSFVIDWHDLFGFPDQDRNERPRDRFRVEAVYQDRSAFAVDPHELQLTDIPIGLRFRLLGDDTAALAARAVVELPTGDQGDGFGNGGVDVALGLVGDVQLGPLALFAHGHYSLVHTTGRAHRAGMNLRDVAAWGLGASMRVTDAVSLHLQTQAETSVLADLGFDRAADIQWLLWAGLRVACSEHVFLDFALGEDLGPYVSPDFSVWASLGVTLGPGGGVLPR